MSQRKYIGEILKTTGLQDAKPSSIPLDPGYVKKEDDGNKLPDNIEYQKLIGKLLYVAVNTRPDISTAVSLLSRKTSNPSQADWTELKRVVRYLKGTKDFKLRLSRNGGPNAIVGYSDADWAENRQDRKSNSGFIFKINGGTVSWACRKQSCVSLSTAEAEFIALSEAVQEAIWLKSLLKDLNEKQEVTIHEDNQSCLKMLINEKFSNRTKHVATRLHFTRDQIQKGEINCIYCPTENMVADLLTKPLARMRMRKLAEMAGLTATV